MQKEENLRCKRILILAAPDDSVSKVSSDFTASSWYSNKAYFCLRKDVRAVVSKKHSNGGGMLDIIYGETEGKLVEGEDSKQEKPPPQSLTEEKIYGMTSNDRYPSIALLLDTLCSGAISGNEVIFSWPLPKTETAVIVNMAESRGATVEFVDAEGNEIAGGTVSAMDWGSGRIRIRFEFSGDSNTQAGALRHYEAQEAENNKGSELEGQSNVESFATTTETGDGGEQRASTPINRIAKKPAKKSKPSKPITTIRFDKSAILSDDFLQEGDVVICDVHQYRPTGQFEALNVRVLQKSKIEPSVECVGIICDVVALRQLGFISVLDIDKEAGNVSIKETLFFHTKATSGGSKLQKGDEVRFNVSTMKPNNSPAGKSKRIAVNIERLPPGTLPEVCVSSLKADITSRHENNLCQGKYV